MSVVPEDIIGFWLGASATSPDNALARKSFWYDGGKQVDQEIRVRFVAILERALSFELDDWVGSPAGALALTLLLDQFTSNLYRNTPKAYSGDEAAASYLRLAIETGVSLKLDVVSTIWLHHPLHHSESLKDQETGLDVLKTLRAECDEKWLGYVDRSIKGWEGHWKIIKEFGRFPHRNEILTRKSSTDEALFLSSRSVSFGQGPKRL